MTVTSTRVRARVEGEVQGVSFRPFVYRLAGDLGLSGWVLNDECGVVAEVEGEPAAVQGFLSRLRTDAPPLAAVEGVTAQDVRPEGSDGFRILASERRGEPE